jgi:hypothetical protein
MPNLAISRQDEVFITRGNRSGAESRAIQRRARQGELVRIAEGIYLRERDAAAQKAIVRRNWIRVLGALVPGAVVSHRSAYAGGLTREGIVFLSHPTRFHRKIAFPGVQAVLVKGPGPLPGDMPLGDGKLHFASRARQILENLAPARRRDGKSAGAKAVESLLVKILHANDEAGLLRIRDEARALSKPLRLGKRFERLDRLIGALLASRDGNVLKTKEGRLVASGTPVDMERMARFETLAATLRSAVLARRPAIAESEPARSHFAFLEAYFSNYVEGTEFEIEVARDIALQGRIAEGRPKDSHDILGVFQLALRSPGRDTVPAFGSRFPEGLAERHAQMLERRPEIAPGAFKLEPNRAGGTWFVDPRNVRGTLIEGSLLARSVPEGLARAVYYSFLVTEVHPFQDGNGRIARLVMNAELSRVGEARIIIPTLFHEEYVDCQRQLSRHDDPEGLIRALSLMQRWTVAFDYADVDSLIAAVRRTNALERSRRQFRLRMPDGSALARERA